MAGTGKRGVARRADAALRRVLDVVVALLALLLLAPVLLAAALLVRASSPGPALFVHRRVGRGGRTFGLVKLRTMHVAAAPGAQITVAGDARVTPLGRVLRRTKLDELPQLWNVLRGDMSLVGPRPEVPEYVLRYGALRHVVLAVRPGITDPASLAYRDEEALLGSHPEPEAFYREQVLPRKLALSAGYLERRTVWTDVGVLLRTASALLVRRRPAGAPAAAEAPVGDGTGASAVPTSAVGPGGLGARVVSGVKWSAVAYYGDSVLRLGISIAIARLLSPGDFGTVALATSVVGVLALVQESGLSAALVQHRGDLDPAATATLYLTLAGGVALGAATWLLAPWIAELVGQPQVASVLAPLSLLFLLHGLAHAPKAVLQREMAFRALAGVRIASTVVYGATATLLALDGFGVWSLVAATLAAEGALTAGAWLVCPWRPRRLRLDVGVARALGGFGRHILGANVLSLLRDRLPVLLIGRLLGADVVGLYWMAARWATLPVDGVTFVVSRVAYPTYTRLRDDRPALARAFRTTLEVIALLAVPAAVGLALVAGPLVELLYDPRWRGAATLLSVLAFYGLFHALAASTGEVFKAAGAPKLVLLYAVVYLAALAALLVVLGTWLGVVGVALAVSGSALLVALLALSAAARLLGIRRRELARLGLLPLGAGGALALAVWGVDALAVRAGLPAWGRLVAEVAVGAVTYVAVVLAARPGWRPRAGGRSSASRFAAGLPASPEEAA